MLRELPSTSTDNYSDADEEEEEEIRWMMKAATVVENAGRRSFTQWTHDAFSGFLDLLKVCVHNTVSVIRGQL